MLRENHFFVLSTEIEINVCDAVQKIKKVFRCPKRLLISKMGYFSEVTKGTFSFDVALIHSYRWYIYDCRCIYYYNYVFL